MNTAQQATSPLLMRFRRYTVLAWRFLASPKFTVILLLILIMLLAARLLIPQQSDLSVAADAWSTTMPPLIQPVAGLFYFLGFSRIFQSLLFWLPLALLLLNSLLALAVYTPPSWQRVRNRGDDAIEWQHPLAHRAETSVRLPKSPDIFIGALKESLRRQGFDIEPVADENQREVGAARRRWAWLSVVVFYGALILLSLAFLVSYFTLELETVTLFPEQPKSYQIFGGTFELAPLDAVDRSGRLRFVPADNDQASHSFGWRLYLPTVVADLLIWPVAIDPVIIIEAQSSDGEARRLMPVQEELSPATRLILPLDESGTSLTFLIPSELLTFQISPVVVGSETRYNVQVRREAETVPSENLTVRLNQPFTIDEITVTITPGHSLTMVVRRDKALWLYGVSFIGMLASVVVIYFFPPWQLWLIPEVKGRGGQLYGVAEKLGSARGMGEFLEQLLAEEQAEEESPISA